MKELNKLEFSYSTVRIHIVKFNYENKCIRTVKQPKV